MNNPITAVGLMMMAYPNVTRVTAPILMAGATIATEVKAIVNTVYNAALFAFNALATVLTLGMWDKSVENMEKRFTEMFSNAATAVLLPVFAAILFVPVLIVIEISPEGVGEKILANNTE